MGPIDRQTARDRIAQVLRASADLERLFLDLDPYSVEYGAVLRERAASATAGIWSQLEAALPGLEPSAILSNAWAVAWQHPEWMAALRMAAASNTSPAVESEGDRLVEISAGALNSSPVAAAIAAAHSRGLQIPPNLGNSRHLKPGLRLRFALAHRWAKGAVAEDLLEVAATQPNASTYLRCRELVRALRAGHELRQQVAPLSEAGFLTLRAESQALIRANAELRSVVLLESLAQAPDLAKVIRQSRREQSRCVTTLRGLRAAIAKREFSTASQLIRRLGEDDVTRHLVARAFREHRSEAATWGAMHGVRPRRAKADSGSLWAPLPIADAERLERLLEGPKVPTWWSLSPKAIADELAGGSIDPREIDWNSLVRIQRSWPTELQRRLAQSGRFDVLPTASPIWSDLPLKELFAAALTHPAGEAIVGERLAALSDARPVLALLSQANAQSIKSLASKALKNLRPGLGKLCWGGWVVNCVGTPEWRSCARLAAAGADIVAEAVAFRQSGGVPIDADGFRSVVVDLLVNQRRRGAAADDAILRYLAIDPQAAGHVAQRLPARSLRKLLEHPEISARLLDHFASVVPGAMRVDVWRTRLLRATTATRLRALLLEQAHLPGPIPWKPEWMNIAGRGEDRAEALVLACRRDPKQLRLIAKSLGDERFPDAVRAAAARLPSVARRDKGTLELFGALGAAEIPYLSAVMSMADRMAQPGHKLDLAYERHLLPKKAGGSRVILVPHHHLKRIQRSILDRLLQPLGAHDSAYGFVRGRSIQANAAVHVGQPIVANADVSNCFPSIKWPLVLGVFRRDLGHRLGPGAISLLVDICTADGGLPIGAPTSPSLLNRVLLRTDEMLHAAASRLGCRYTRYADDLTFSGDHGAVKLLGVAKRTLSQIGLDLDPKKTTIYRPGRRQIVTGLVVNTRVSVPRRIRRRIRAAVHAVELGREPSWHGQVEQVTSLQGRLSFVNAINPIQATPLIARLRSAKHTTPADDDE